jgi:quinoprotein dehydrogenase-associated probable ABC transporter substrate-binding protein
MRRTVFPNRQEPCRAYSRLNENRLPGGFRSWNRKNWFFGVCRLASALMVPILAFVLSQPVAAAPNHEGRSSSYLTVCGDPNNLPFSNDRMEGFENRIAEIIAKELNRPLHYRWWPQSVGFVRNTLRMRLCDLIMGITSVNEMVQNTNPYYRSVYSLVQRSNGIPRIQSLSDPALKSLRIGVVAGTPPATLIARYGLMDQTRPYLRTVDTRHYTPAAQAVRDVGAGEIDIAVIWGPIAGYFGARQDPPLLVTPLPPKIDGVELAFNVSMGLRHRERQWKHQINALIARLEPEFQRVLIEYRIPLLDADGGLVQWEALFPSSE